MYIPCYYCGKDAPYICDYLDLDTGGLCNRDVCEEHSVAEFPNEAKWAWTLCKEHAIHQVKTDEDQRRSA